MTVNFQMRNKSKTTWSTDIKDPSAYEILRAFKKNMPQHTKELSVSRNLEAPQAVVYSGKKALCDVTLLT